MPAAFLIRDYVRWGDVDFAGIIRWDAYTRFFELGESELFRALGVPYTEFFRRYKCSLPRRVAHMEFVSPPRLDEPLQVSVYVSRVGTTSLTLNFDVRGPGGAMRAFGHLVLVCAELDGMGKAPWPAEFLVLLEPYRMSVEEARQHHGDVA
jgi:acyl-CoA thioesterase FadM